MDDSTVLKMLEECESYANKQTELTARLSDMYWLITLSKRKPGGCTVTGAEDVREDLEASVRVKQVMIAGKLEWRLVRAADINTKVDESALDTSGLRNRGKVTPENRYCDSTNSSSSAGIVGMLHGAYSPTLRKLATAVAPAALQSVCDVANAADVVLKYTTSVHT
jgi:hypothetical protein